MPTLQITELLQPMRNAAQQVLAKQWPEVENYVDHNLKAIGASVLDLQASYAAKEITEAQAKLDFEIAANTAKMTLITSAGLSEIMAAKVINGALSAVKVIVNKALGFVLF